MISSYNLFDIKSFWSRFIVEFFKEGLFKLIVITAISIDIGFLKGISQAVIDVIQGSKFFISEWHWLYRVNKIRIMIQLIDLY